MNQKQRHLLQLNVAENSESDRHGFWLELFFDLVFVVAIAQLAHFLHDELNWVGIANTAVLIVPIWTTAVSNFLYLCFRN